MAGTRLTIGIAFAVLLPTKADPCSCFPPPLLKNFNRASVVFRGELVAAMPNPERKCGDELLTFLVSRTWKGPKEQIRLVLNGAVGRHADGSLPGNNERTCISQCPVMLRERQEYVVFGYGNPARLEYCGSTAEARGEGSDEFIGELDALAQNVP